MNPLEAPLKAFFLAQGLEKTYWIAYSGGLDSHVLLSLCHELRSKLALQLRVIHINHGLSPHADDWASHSAEVCAQYQMDFTARQVQIDCRRGESLEEAARQLRYAVFAECLNEGEVLLTAHHQDDQAETLLLQLLRGSGPKGLAAMPRVKPFARGVHARPMLSFSRADLQQYAENQKLDWVCDESNENIQFKRNFVRHSLIPLLKTRWPSVERTLARTSRHCAEAQTLLEEFALEMVEKLGGKQPNTLSVSKLLQLNPARQRLVLRSWIQAQGFPLPDTRKMNSIQENVLKASLDCTPCVTWQQVDLRRYRDDIFIMRALQNEAPIAPLTWTIAQPLALPDLSLLQAQSVFGRGLHAGIKQVFVQFRRGGETANFPKRGNRRLKNLFQEWSIPPWQRSRIPLLFVGDTLAAVPGYFLHQDYSAKNNEAGHEICWSNA